MLSRDSQLQGGHIPVPRAGPFLIWNELWPSFSVLINAHEAEVSRGQNTPLWSAISSAIADLFHFLKEFHSVLALETAVHEATLSRLRASGQPDGSKSKLARALETIREPVPRAPWATLLDQVKGDVIAAEKLDMLESRDLNRVANFEKYRRDSRPM